MKDFVHLYKTIDLTSSTNAKIEALVSYFTKANDLDKLWTIALFTGRRPSRSVTTTLLRIWAAEQSNLPLWLFEETYHIVGDLAETISLVITNQESKNQDSLSTIINELIKIKPLAEDDKKSFIINKWSMLNADERFVFNKIITGGFRLGVSQKTVTKALARLLNIDENIIAHRLMGDWSPLTHTFKELIEDPSEGEDDSKPYPFYLAYALDKPIHELGDSEDWSAEWKWDGIRGQLIKRNDNLFIWSRGEELITSKFPEFDSIKQSSVNNFVIDGEIIPIVNGVPLPFQSLQTRIGRKNITKKILSEVPIHIIAYDLLELEWEDLRSNSFIERRRKLQSLLKDINSPLLLYSQDLNFKNWDDLSNLRMKSRENHAEGLMLKKKSSQYLIGRKKGEWWKWKVDPLEVDAVMLYAQRGHGRRANLYTDFTFAVRDGDNLVPIAKAYSGLTDAEFREVTQFVRKNTRERFGPVASVNPELVFTIAFEAISKSKRHKSGVALRFPRISRWRKDKGVGDIDTIQTLFNML